MHTSPVLGKHIEGHNSFDPDRSPVKVDPQELLDGFIVVNIQL